MARHPLPNKFSIPGHHGDNNKRPSHHNDCHSLDGITNEIYEDMMQNKSESAHNFDELGILDLDKAVKAVTEDALPCLDLSEPARNDQVGGTKDSGRTGKTKPKVTFALQKNTTRNPTSDNDDEALFERLNWAQNQSLDDQRGLAPRDLELPEFLRDDPDTAYYLQGRESAPAALTHESRELPASKDANNKSVLNEIDEYIESINENFAAYTREKVPQRHSEVGTSNARFRTDGRTLHHFKTFGSPGGRQLSYSDKSFSQDGILPEHEDAETLFQSSGRDSPDFTDPHLTDKSLTDIGFSYDYNKYLSKSRSFIKVRNRPKTSASGNLSVINPPTLPPEILSPNQTLRSDILDQSDLFDTTLTLSRRSSSYSSDSSLDKENIIKLVPKISAKNLQRTSRNTLIHSPITTQEEDHFLSTVDTDSKLILHSTPKSGHHGVSNAGNTPKTLDPASRGFQRQLATANLPHAEPVTFV